MNFKILSSTKGDNLFTVKNMSSLSECNKNPIRSKLLKTYKNSMSKSSSVNFTESVKPLKFNLPATLNCTSTLSSIAPIGSSKESKKIKICSLTSNNIHKLSLNPSKNSKTHNNKQNIWLFLLFSLKKKGSLTSSEKQNSETTQFCNSISSKHLNKTLKNPYNIVMT